MDLQRALYFVLMSEKFQHGQNKDTSTNRFYIKRLCSRLCVYLFKPELAKTYENDRTFS